MVTFYSGVSDGINGEIGGVVELGRGSVLTTMEDSYTDAEFGDMPNGAEAAQNIAKARRDVAIFSLIIMIAIIGWLVGSPLLFWGGLAASLFTPSIAKAITRKPKN